jgi:hypothetical protein
MARPMVLTTSRRVVVLPINMDHLRMWRTITPAWSCWSTEYWMGYTRIPRTATAGHGGELRVGNDKLIIDKIN